MQRRAILERMHGKTNRSQHFFLTIRPVLSSIGPNSDQRNADPLQKLVKKPLFARLLPAAGLLSLAPLGACDPAPVEEIQPEAAAELSCGEAGTLETSLYGGIETTLRWSGSEMTCESMPRPNGEGLRLRLAGDVSGETLAFIIALPELKPGQQGVESPSNVTATVEGSGRFFSTPDLDTCWTDVRSQSAVPDTDNEFTLQGVLFCIAPLGELNGDAAVSIPNLAFNTRVTWNTR